MFINGSKNINKVNKEILKINIDSIMKYFGCFFQLSKIINFVRCGIEILNFFKCIKELVKQFIFISFCKIR